MNCHIVIDAYVDDYMDDDVDAYMDDDVQRMLMSPTRPIFC